MRLVGGIGVRSAYAHRGPPRVLVHRLKYEAVSRVAELLAVPMAPLVPTSASVLVPIPRTLVRRVRYGIDPAAELASALARLTGLPVHPRLRPPVAARRHAGKGRLLRPAPGFTVSGHLPRGAVLVDDVVTTGVTLQAAADAFGRTGLPRPVGAVTGTAADSGN